MGQSIILFDEVAPITKEQWEYLMKITVIKHAIPGRLSVPGWGNLSCRHCRGILEYVYHIWYQCRSCGRWAERGL